MFRVMKIFLMVAVVVVVFQECAFATATKMPYETWLKMFKDSVTGPVAAALILIGMVGAGAMLVWGGEIGTFLKTMIYLTLVACLIVGAGSLFTDYFEGSEGHTLRPPAVVAVVEPEGVSNGDDAN